MNDPITGRPPSANEQLMRWYTAHLVMFLKYKEHPQDCFTLWENVVLIQADTAEEAWEKAERRGREDEGDCDGTLTCDEKPAEWVLAGVRQIVLSVDPEERPGDGTEVSYSELQVDSMEELEQFVQGKWATVHFVEVPR